MIGGQTATIQPGPHGSREIEIVLHNQQTHQALRASQP
jgi:hypothetical protein